MKNMAILIGFIAFVMKIGIHIFLDKRHSRFEGYSPAGMNRFYYFFFYMQNVNSEFINIKRVCNFLFATAITFFLFAFIM